MEKYTYGAEFTARERKRINDILYRMKKVGFNITPETRTHITSATNVREQAAAVTTFQAISSRGNRVGAVRPGTEALRLHEKAVEYNRQIDIARRSKKYKGYDLEKYKVNVWLTGLSPSSIHTKRGIAETREDFKERLKEEGRKAAEAAEKAWSRSITEALDEKRETMMDNFMGIIGDRYPTSLELPEELKADIRQKLENMDYKTFTETMRKLTAGDSNIFEFYKSGYDDTENGLREMFTELGYDVEEGRSLPGTGFDRDDNVVYLQDIMDEL